MRGENALINELRNRPAGSSPHARGKQLLQSRIRRSQGLIPACTGKTLGADYLNSAMKAHPRMRGENTAGVEVTEDFKGSSPHARGKRQCNSRPDNQRGLIPACAGKTSLWFSWLYSFRAHPRMRGENQRSRRFIFRPSGSSPHARGKPNGLRLRVQSLRLIPACAGKTATNEIDNCVFQAHPRMRGENQCPQKLGHTTRGSSPHARGKHRCSSARGRGLRLIPACAGKTTPPRYRACWGPAHPRMRGENCHQ